MADKTEKQRVILCVTNDLVTDQRVHRMALALVDMGFEVCCVGRLLPESPPMPVQTYTVRRFKLWFWRGKLFYLNYNLRLLLYLLGQKCLYLTANDLDTLPACWLAARLKGFRLVYDSHEVFTQVPELLHRPLTQKVWQVAEKLLVPGLKRMMTVNDTIARLYSKEYKLDVLAVYNYPFRRSETINVEQRPRVLLYQGALNLGRGLELMIAALEHLPGFELWLVGAGDLETELRQRVKALPWAERIVFKGRVPYTQLPALTRLAGVGLSLEEDLGLNYRLSTPNKLFDYVQAGLPCIVSDLPEMAAIVRRHGVGLVLEERTPSALAALAHELYTNTQRYIACHQAALQAAHTLCWEVEREKLKAIYLAG